MDDTRSQPQPLLYQIEQDGKTPHSSTTPRQRYIVFFAVATVLIACGTVVWVLNLVGTIPGPWSSVFGAIFAGVGMIVALLNALLALTRTHGG